MLSFALIYLVLLILSSILIFCIYTCIHIYIFTVNGFYLDLWYYMCSSSYYYVLVLICELCDVMNYLYMCYLFYPLVVTELFIYLFSFIYSFVCLIKNGF